MYARNGFTIEIYGFTHSFVPFRHVLLIMTSQWSQRRSRTGRMEDDDRLENEYRDIEGGG